MKHFGIHYLVVFLLLVNSNSMAQFRGGIQVGLNLSSMTWPNDIAEDTYFKLGFHLGPTTEYMISDNISLEAGLFFSTRGCKNEIDHNGYHIKRRNTLYYLDIPVTSKVSFDIGDKKIFLSLGPSFGIGLFGKEKGEIIEPDRSTSWSERIEWGGKLYGELAEEEEVNVYKRFDFGLIAGTGIEIKTLYVGFSYILGLREIHWGYSPVKHRVFQLSFGYKFGGRHGNR